MESYRFDKRHISHRKRHIALAVLVLILLVAAGFWAKSYFKANTTISPPPAPVISTVTSNKGPTRQFDQGIFSLLLPADWTYKGQQRQTSPYAPYLYENTKTNPGVEQLEIYVDTIPTTLGVNRVLPVQGEGARVVPTTVSDNCADFTGNKVPGSTSTPAKWDGFDFLCDLGNYERDVVGTSSSDGVDVVKLSGPTTGAHTLFFTYTDNGSTPDFTIFTDALSSFRLK